MEIKQDDREYEVHINALKKLLNEDKLDFLRIDKEIDSIIAVKKSYTNDIRLETNRATRGLYESKLAQHDEVVKEVLRSSSAIQASSRVKMLSDLIERSTLYSNMEGKGNSELLSGAQGNKSRSTHPIVFSLSCYVFRLATKNFRLHSTE